MRALRQGSTKGASPEPTAVKKPAATGKSAHS
jgi:hypothetical protein